MFINIHEVSTLLPIRSTLLPIPSTSSPMLPKQHGRLSTKSTALNSTLLLVCTGLRHAKTIKWRYLRKEYTAFSFVGWILETWPRENDGYSWYTRPRGSLQQAYWIFIKLNGINLVPIRMYATTFNWGGGMHYRKAEHSKNCVRICAATLTLLPAPIISPISFIYVSSSASVE